MKRDYVVDRIRSVIGSCETSDQINCALVYSKLLINRWKTIVYNKRKDVNSDYNLLIYYQERELVDWMNVQVTKHRLKLYK